MGDVEEEGDLAEERPGLRHGRHLDVSLEHLDGALHEHVEDADRRVALLQQALAGREPALRKIGAEVQDVRHARRIGRQGHGRANPVAVPPRRDLIDSPTCP